MCSCDRDGLCPACAEREAAEWEPDPREPERVEAWRETERALGPGRAVRHTAKWEVHPRETFLRGAVLATAGAAPPAIGASLAPHWLIPAFVAVVFIVLGGIAGGVVVLFYALWTIGWLSFNDPACELMGDDGWTVHAPRPYWPWSRRVRAIRRRRHITALEIANGVPPDRRWYS